MSREPDVVADLEAVATEANLIPLDPDRWLLALSRVKGQQVAVRILRTRVRSLRANAHLFVTYGKILRGFREYAQDHDTPLPFRNKDELHEWFKIRLLGYEKKIVEGVEIMRPRSTTDLTDRQFAEFIDDVKATAATKWSIYVE